MKNHSKRSLLAKTWLALMLAMTGGWHCQDGLVSPRKKPQANNGLMDLRAQPFGANDTYLLSGSWSFYWKKLVPPTRTTTEPVDGFVEVPGVWTGQKPKGEPLPGKGYATYALRILLPASVRSVSLKQMPVDTAYVLFAGGKEVARNGMVGRSPAESRPQWVPLIVDLTPESFDAPVPRPALANPNTSTTPAPTDGMTASGHRELQLVLHTANFHLNAGGPFYGTRIGSTAAIRSDRETGLLRDAVLAGTLLLFGFYHLALFFLRRQDHSAAYFGLATLAAAVHAITHGEKLFFQMLPGGDFEILQKINVLGGYLVLPLWLGFLRGAFPKDFWKPAIRGFQFVALGFVAVVLVMPAEVHFRTGIPYYLVNLLAFLYASVVLLRAAFGKTTGAALVLGGVLAILGTLLHDLLFELGYVRGVPLFSAGIFVFFFVQAIGLARMFSGAFEQIATLSEELEERNRNLTRLDELKDEFLANTSHELRTPLNGIIGITESLIEGASGPLPEATIENLRLVASGGRRLSNLVNDILDFAKLQHRDLILRLRPLDLDPVIDMVVRLSAPLVGNRPVELLHRREGVFLALADEERVEQILHNLIGNAIKFTKTGKVTIATRELPGSPEMIEISVTDTGIGIPQDKQALIFESFTQADGSVAREYGGTGLGLTITKKLVELHGGSLSVRSAPGEGSRFAFTLPAASAAIVDDVAGRLSQHVQPELPPAALGSAPTAVSATAALDVALGPTSTAAPGTGRVALIVDDDPVNLQVLRNHLGLHGYGIAEALSGAEALQILHSGLNPDVVLLDVMMPGLSGYEVCRIIRESHSPSQLPVIMLTARTQTADLVNGLESGANDFVAKPFEPGELLARVGTVVKLKEAARSQSDLAAIKKELRLAREIQQSLLPAAEPNLPGVDVAMRYRAMEKVGGDFFDFREGDGKLGLVMADVSGHGIPAALIVSIVKVAFWFQDQELLEPADLFANMNRILLNNVGHEFVTACYCFVDLANRKLRVSNAGHPPILVLRADGEILRLRPFGRLLGILPDGQYETEEVPLLAGDRIMLYTDGIFEAANAEHEQFGSERLEEELRSSRGSSAAEFTDRLIETVTDWSGGPKRIQDDVALVVVDIE